MAIRTSGSGGSIKLTGTGGGMRITSSGGGGSPPMTMLGAWYRADDLNQADGSSVSTWADRSGNGADLVAISGISQPTLIASSPAFNGQKAIDLNGSQQLQRLLPPGYQGSDSAFSAYIVAQPANAGSLYAFCWGQPFGTGDNVALAWFTYLGNRAFTTTDSAVMGSPVFSATSNPQIVSVFNGQAQDIATSETLIDGAIPATLGPGEPGVLSIPVPVAEVRLGSHFGNGSTVFTGQIAEIIYYKKKHDSSERAATLSYLSSRYGISI